MKKLTVQVQRGFTLIELLIALAISLFLLAALVQIMASSTQSYRAHEGVSRIQEGGRYAIEIIGRQVRNAGYHSDIISQNLEADPALWPLNTPPNPPSDPGNPAGFAIEGTEGATPADPDSLTVRYYIPDDCNTAACVPAPVPIIGAIPTGDWIRVVFQVDAATRILRCQIFNSAGTDISGDQPILDGVTNMKIFYGLQIGNDMRYEKANTMIVTDWPSVVSVRIDFTMDSIDAVNPNSPALNASGGRLERRYSATLTARNRIPGARS